MENKYYSFRDIILGLRGEYIKNQQYLDLLKDYLVIDGKEDAITKMYAEERISNTIISIDILNTQIELLKAVKYFLYQLGSEKDVHATYSLSKRENDIAFSRTSPKSRFNPIIEIKDKDSFMNNYDNLMNSSFMNLKNVYTAVNNYQRLLLSPAKIKLTDALYIYNSANYELEYNPANDSFISYQNKNVGNDYIYYFLKTKIPKELIPEDYREIIDANMDEQKNIVVVDELTKGTTELAISDNPYVMHLSKKIIPRGYNLK